MREDQVWSIFRCLIKALKVMDHGREQNSKSPSYTHRPIIHFDIKHQNCKCQSVEVEFIQRLTIFQASSAEKKTLEESMTAFPSTK
jgi:hypothetical protein